jgi:hypothetical protein
MKARTILLSIFLPVLLAGLRAQEPGDSNAYLHWSQQEAESVGKSTYHDGKVGSRELLVWLGVDTRLLKTERSQNYKIRATWFTPEVIRASARSAQLRDRLSDKETQALVAEAEAVSGTVVMIELDPNEGSGVIPLDWSAFLQPKGNTSPNEAVRGVKMPELRKAQVFQGVQQRNYDYERFWFAFPLVRDDGNVLVPPDKSELELVVRIYNREGTVNWLVPPSIRALEDTAKRPTK